MPINEFKQPVGESLPGHTPGERPSAKVLAGRYCRLEKLSAARHGADLYAVYGPDSPLPNWTYLPLNPVADTAELDALLHKLEQSADPYYFAIIDQANGQAVGTMSLMRVDTANRVIEVGWVIYSERLKRSRIATEAQFLLAQYVFETLRYRRYEWKCDALNQASCRAAERLGFRFEGVFRQAVVYKGRNRDTAWFAMLDSEWPQVKRRMQRWLAEENFDAQGRQRVSLQEIE
ncbi:GNAT family N-acetyltransferase [Eikenella sp. S3360]|uniref:GNAT family N-acetyltransferase n=1 Tax=Eikenella glucosivorans TaxID=2766967 RepID=A0ABS0NCZ1_9NEIS|nr:GNAT family protein [Eikenella glucosivorans]MBH5330186.1 GNAT family N-acetyltransferase [Eikenella glucosivorans]